MENSTLKTNWLIIGITTCLIVWLLIASSTVVKAQTYTKSEISSKLQQYTAMKETYWTTDGKAANSNGSTSKQYYGIQCKGFATWVYYKLFDITYIGAYDENKYYIPNASSSKEIGRCWNVGSGDLSTVKSLYSQAWPGDFIQVRRRGKSYGHSMIVVDVYDYGIKVLDCNSDGHCKIRVYDITWSDFAAKNIGMSLYRANNYSGEEKPSSATSSLNLGDEFCAYIINTATWTHVTPDLSGTNIFVQKGDADRKVWYFQRLSNGSYKITATDGRCMEVHNFEKANGTNVELNNYGDNSAQHWLINGESGAYQFRAECGTNVLDMKGGSSEDGTNIQMWESNGSYSQKFQIWKLPFPSPGYIGGTGGTHYTPTTIWWDKGSNTTSYDLRLWRNGSEYKTIWSLKENSTSLDLPEGNYKATITYCNGYSYKMGLNELSFTVEKGKPVDLGDEFCAYITNTTTGTHVTPDLSGTNIFVQKGDADQKVWYFQRLSNGSYKITATDGRCMEVHNFETVNGTNVELNNYGDNSAQHWYITGESGVYQFRAECGMNVLEMKGGSSEDGTNIQMWENNGSYSQKFQIRKLPFPTPGYVGGKGGTHYTPSTIWWDKGTDANSYDLRLWKDGSEYKTIWGIKENSVSLNLPKGNYKVTVAYCNGYSYKMSLNELSFTVEVSKPVNMGEDLLARIYGNYKWIPVTNNNGIAEVQMEEDDNQNQIWRFKRQSDGTYLISSLSDGSVLTVQAGDIKDGSPVILSKETGSENQKWFVYGEKSGEFILQPKLSEKVLNISGGNNNPGDKLNLWEVNYSNAQLFAIEKTADIELGVPDVKVTKQPDLDNNVLFTWNKCANATAYDLKIYDKNGENLIYQYDDLKQTSKAIDMPVGDYTALVYAKNDSFNIRKPGSIINVTAKKALSKYSLKMNDESYVYDGKEKKPGITLVDATGNVLSDSSYSVIYENNIDAGMATVKVEGKGYYTDTLTGSFQIEKASQVLDVSADSTILRDSDSTKLLVNGLGSVSYVSDNEKVATVSEDGTVQGHLPGKAVITATASGDKNHTYAKAIIELSFAHGYDEGVVTKKATCTEEGIRTFTCSGCGDSFTEVIPAIGHEWDEGKISHPVTCKNDGEIVYSCKNCGMKQNEVLECFGHIGEEVLKFKKQATCERNGYSGDVFCNECGELLQEGDEVPATGHKYGDWIVTKEPTYDSEGEEQRTCENDPSHIETRTIGKLQKPTTGEESSTETEPTTETKPTTETESATETKPTTERESTTNTEPDTGTDSATKTNLPKTADQETIKVADLKLAGISKKIAAGKKIKLTPTVLPENASNKKLRWTTSNKKVATVTQNGVVSIKKKTGGKSVMIVAAATDGSNKKAVWKIKVMKGVVKKITVKTQKRTLKINKTMKLNATVKATAGANKKLIWTSSNKKWATVSSKGVVKALKAGKGKTVKIIVMATDGSNIKKVVKLKIN